MLRKIYLTVLCLSTIAATALVSQNVGIGTPTPLDKLHVKEGNVRLDDSATVNFYATSADTSGIRFLTDDVPEGGLFYFGDTPGLNISSSEAVHGIFYDFDQNDAFVGRTYPINKFEKFGVGLNAFGLGGMYIETYGSANGQPFYGYAIDSISKAYHYYHGATNTWRLYTGGDRLTVKNSTGDVGIGITDPLDRLHIYGGSLRVDAVSPMVKLFDGLSYKAFLESTGDDLILSNRLNGRTKFGTDNMIRMTIDSIGYVGIGEEDPDERLHVAGHIVVEDPTPTINLFKGGSNISGYLNHVGFSMYLMNKTVSGHLFLGTNDVPRLTIRDGGNVGIGNGLIPFDKLHVQGSARLEAATPALKLYQGATYVASMEQTGDHLTIENKLAGNLNLGTQNVDRMTIDFAGNVGIGLTSPDERLHVSGNIIADAPLPELKFYQAGVPTATINQNADNLSMENLEAGSINFRTDGQVRLVITNNGDVGLGTTTPAERLHITGGNMGLENTNPILRFYEGGVSKSHLYAWGDHFIVSNNMAGDLQLRTKNLVRMTIDSNGMVGIGTTTPTSRLDVVGAVEFDSLGLGVASPDRRLHVAGPVKFANAGSTPPQTHYFWGATHSATILADATDLVLNKLASGDISLQTNGTTRMTVAADGNVGVGVSAPQYRLDMTGKLRIADDVNPQIRFDKEGANVGFLDITTDDLRISNKSTGNIDLMTSNTARLSVSNSGHIGIGTTSPSYRLDVNGGNLRITHADPRIYLREMDGTEKTAIIDLTGGEVLFKCLDGGLDIRTGGDVTRMTVADDGDVAIDGTTFAVNTLSHRVGIGTAAPQAKLDIVGSFEVDNETFRVDDATNQVMIGTYNPASGYALSVAGKIMSEEIKVQLEGSWPDYVFEPAYERMTLAETQQFIQDNGHLPGVPSAVEVDNNSGIELGEMNRILLEKVEELTLHLIDLSEQNKDLERELSSLRIQVKHLYSR